ncbi:RimK family alpha-L-glutamate ligase [Kitasatospora sp. NPDC094019]|uniref:ATP-grasp domain-containing protein n=1 Tax=Kitasatospora sp. NPDC094019 TaxID=3364091 RepID=UPI0038022C17
MPDRPVRSSTPPPVAPTARRSAPGPVPPHSPPPRSPFLAQLDDPARTLDARPRPTPCVLLLSRACDTDLDPVRNLLAGAGIRTARLNAEELAATSLTIAPDGRTVRLNGRELIPTVTWIRHFAPTAFDPASPVSDTALTTTRGAFLRDSWQAATAQLAAISGTAVRPDRPGVLCQLDLARRYGVAVPRSVLTTDPHLVRDEFDGPRVVVKAAGHHFVEPFPGRLHGIFPTVLDRADLAGGPRPGPPVIVQEYVEHEAELRVYFVGGHLHAFAVTKTTPADPWTAPDRLGVRALPSPPPDIAAATRTLAAAMSLRYGAFDFLLSGGTPVFLEVNPDGDWRWAERRTRTTPVTVAVAAMLAALHRAAL